MSNNEIEAALAFLKKTGHLSPAHVTTFVSYWEKPGVKPQKLTVEIHDSGEANPEQRYTCIIRAEDGRGDCSNPMPTIESAIGSVKWLHLNLR
jgi:hypothetical protein